MNPQGVGGNAAALPTKRKPPVKGASLVGWSNLPYVRFLGSWIALGAISLTVAVGPEELLFDRRDDPSQKVLLGFARAGRHQDLVQPSFDRFHITLFFLFHGLLTAIYSQVRPLPEVVVLHYAPDGGTAAGVLGLSKQARPRAGERALPESARTEGWALLSEVDATMRRGEALLPKISSGGGGEIAKAPRTGAS